MKLTNHAHDIDCMLSGRCDKFLLLNHSFILTLPYTNTLQKMLKHSEGITFIALLIYIYFKIYQGGT